MLCSRFKQILLTKTTLNNNVQYRCFINTRFVTKRYGVDGFWSSLTKHRRELQIMSSVRFIFKDIRVSRLWSSWSRSVIFGHVVRRCRKDKSVREVIHSFRQTIFRPRHSLLFYATAACKAQSNDEKPGKPQSCRKGISDEEMENLLSELDGIEELSRQTLYCENCSQRMVIDKQVEGVAYCPCKDAKPPEGSPDGWVPYMEAEDVIIWRKEYKPGMGLFAYKVYGRYKEVRAEDFAAVNVDSGYRRKWDNAVAALAVVERNANGVPDQAVLHWEVLWPRLFANRDYVYIRRHKEYILKGSSIHSPHILDAPSTTPKTEDSTPSKAPETPPKSNAPPKSNVPSPPTSYIPPLPPGAVYATPPTKSRPSVHDNAKQKSLEMYSNEPETPKKVVKVETPPPSPPRETTPSPPPEQEKPEKIYVIISRSCLHPEVPVTRNAIRVQEYWSHMVVKTLYAEGAGEVGMEFVLTYYDEPTVGGMPSGVTAWATGRATPAFLAQIRAAARSYAQYRKGRKEEDFAPFRPETKEISYEEGDDQSVREEDMESSKTGPELNGNGRTHDVETQTDETRPPSEGSGDKSNGGDKPPGGDKGTGGGKVKVTEEKAVNTGDRYDEEETPTRPGPFKVDSEIAETQEHDENENKENVSWWRYMYPSYYLG